jgi:hypothetical protein
MDYMVSLHFRDFYVGVFLKMDHSHHAEGLVDPNLMKKKMVTDFGYPRACRFRIYQINRLSELPLPTFFKT